MPIEPLQPEQKLSSEQKVQELSVSPDIGNTHVSGLPLSNPEIQSAELSLDGSGNGVSGRTKRTWFFKYFRYGYREGREMNFRIGKFCLRIAQHQLALWKNSNPVFNLIYFIKDIRPS